VANVITPLRLRGLGGAGRPQSCPQDVDAEQDPGWEQEFHPWAQIHADEQDDGDSEPEHPDPSRDDCRLECDGRSAHREHGGHRIAYTCRSSPVTWRPTARVSGRGAAADCNAMSGISPPAKAVAVNSMATNSRPLPKNTDAKNRSARCRSGGGIRPVPAGSPALRGETRRGRRGCVLARGPAGPARGHQPPWGGLGPGRAATAGPGGRRRLRARIPAPGRPGRAGRTCRPRWRSCRRRARPAGGRRAEFRSTAG
jgi:hypothetical protein